MSKPKTIKSKQRVRDYGEVYTPEQIVRDMLDLLPHDTQAIDSTYLEPACGNGAFLIEILRRKLERCKEDAHLLGVHPGIDPFMSLSFVALPVIPSLRLTTKGVFNLDTLSFADQTM